MFMLHISLSAALIALAVGVGLYIWSLHTKLKKASRIARFFGILIIVFSILGFLVAGVYGIKYWIEGYFRVPMALMNGGSEIGNMMKKLIPFD